MDGIFTTRFVDPYLKFHKYVYERSDGRVGKHSGRVPALLLTTTGRRSGLARTNGLTYCRDRGDLIVVASNGGSDRPPAWLLNLQADPRVTVRVGPTRLRGHRPGGHRRGAGPAVAAGQPDQPGDVPALPPGRDRPLRRLPAPHHPADPGGDHHVPDRGPATWASGA